MNLRFITAAGFLAAAPLLGGSAFAFAPEFQGDLPTVIITDKLEDPNTDFDLPLAGPASSGLIRYTEAFDLYDYIRFEGSPLTTGEKSQVKWGFTVENNDDIYIINGERRLPNAPTPAELASGANLGTDGVLSFWNRDFSGDDTTITTPPVGGFSPIGVVTGDNLLSGPQERVVTIYIRGAANSVESAPMTVISTLDGSDRLILSQPSTGPSTGPVDPWVTEVATTNNFAGWTRFDLHFFDVFSSTGSAGWNNLNDPNQVYQGGPRVAGVAPPPLGSEAIYGNPTITTGLTYLPTGVPNLGTTPVGTTSLRAEVFGTYAGPNGTTPKIGLAAWLNQSIAVSVQSNDLYRLRSRVARSNANYREAFRVRLGDASNFGGSYTSLLTSTGTNVSFLPTTATNLYTYLVPKVGTAPATTLPIFFEIWSLGSIGNAFTDATAPFAGSGLNISEYEISRTTRAALGTGNVLFNRGADTIPALAAGELPLATLGTPATATAGFSIAATAAGAPRGGVTEPGAPASLQGRSLTAQPNGSLNFTMNASTNAGQFPRQVPEGSGPQVTEFGWTWATIVNFLGWTGSAVSNANNPTDPGLVNVTAGKIYVADVFLSSAQATTPNAGGFPNFRVRMQSNGTYEDVALFDLGSRVAGNGAQIGTAVKVYSGVSRPAGLAGPAPTGAHLFIDFFATGKQNAFGAPTTARTITIHRIVITEFDDFIN